MIVGESRTDKIERTAEVMFAFASAGARGAKERLCIYEVNFFLPWFFFSTQKKNEKTMTSKERGSV